MAREQDIRRYPKGIDIKDASEGQIAEAASLPYRELIGILMYAAACTKIELRYALSVLAQRNKGWLHEHFSWVLRCVECGYSTRHRGMIWSRKDPHGVNTIWETGDASFQAPRSKRARFVMLNGAAISVTSAMHKKKTNTSTAEAEAEEAFHCSTDIVAMRFILEELGHKQIMPTTLYCDSMAVIQIMENKGPLAKWSKAMDIQIYALRDRMIDQQY